MKKDNQQEIGFMRGILKGIIYDPKLMTIRILILISSGLAIIQLLTNLTYACSLTAIQTMIFPHWAASVFLGYKKYLLQFQQWKAGALVGAITGLIPSILIFVVGVIRFLSPEFRHTFLASKGLDIASLDPSVETGGVIFAFVTIVISFVIISSLTGFMAALLPVHKLLEKLHIH